MDYKKIISEHIHRATSKITSSTTSLEIKEIIEKIEVPPDRKLGDFAFPCFILSKALKKSPQNIALELKEKLNDINIKEEHKYFELINNEGPYLNFFVNKEMFIKHILKKVLEKKNDYGRREQESKEVILIESPGPNTNKPLHLGHLRNMMLGQSLFNIQKFLGKDAHIVNVVNDRGVHICKSMLAYQKFGNGATPESANRKSDHFVGDYYVKYAQLEKDHPEYEQEVQEMLKKWEENDEETKTLWKKMNDWTLKGFEQTYKRLDFNIEKEYFESDTYMHGKEIILEGLKKGIFEKDENGAIISDFTNKNLGKKVLLRSNLTSVYITQDIFMANKRYQDFHFDEMVYVVGNEQEYHFKVLFEVFKLLGWKFGEKCQHFSYGMVELPEGKMKSREGTVIDTDDLLDSVNTYALEEVNNRYKLPVSKAKERAELIALSAVRFFFLKFDPVKNFVFDPKESLSFDGETGPYIEYSHARINSIFKKAGEILDKDLENADFSLLNSDKEFEIVLKLDTFPDIITQAGRELKPSTIAHYLIGLAQSFNNFYHANPVLNVEPELRNARLALIKSVKNVLKIGMNLLNIQEIEEM
jgi:arginyl-tRNA synthetase